MNDKQTHLDYLRVVPKQVPEGRVVVHNFVRPTQRLGSRGFHAWTEPVGTPNRIVWTCDWAPHLPEHYRVTTHWTTQSSSSSGS